MSDQIANAEDIAGRVSKRNILSAKGAFRSGFIGSLICRSSYGKNNEKAKIGTISFKEVQKVQIKLPKNRSSSKTATVFVNKTCDCSIDV